MRELGHDALQTQGALGDDLLDAIVAGHRIWALVRLAKIAMQIKVDSSALRQTKWHQYAIRFVFGGLITAIAGMIAKKYGAGVGGLFLAFPAIFPASATLIEAHEKQKKQEHGMEGTERGREAASVDAAGAAMGTIGLLVFALMVWQFLPRHRPSMVLIAATLLACGLRFRLAASKASIDSNSPVLEIPYKRPVPCSRARTAVFGRTCA